MKKEKILIWIIIFISIVFIINGIYKIHHKHLNIKINEFVAKNENLPTTSIKFSNLKVNFGKVPSDTILKAKFKIYNEGDNLLKIYNINPECTCTDYKLSKSDIAIGDSALITLILNTKDKFGETQILTTIKTNTNEKMHLLTIVADVYDKSNILDQ